MILRPTPCPKCGCHMARTFECGCGAVHDDYCVNCGRFVSVPPDRSTELTEVDARCPCGPVQHDHPPEEKSARVQAFYEKIRQRSKS